MTREIINGVPHQFGRHEPDKKLPYLLPNSDGITKTLVYPFFYDDLPVVSANDAGVQLIPANSLIKAAYIYVESDLAGGTSYDFGLYESNGSVISANGIDAAVAEAALETGDWIVCDGALIGASIGTAAGQLVIAATGTFTAGFGKVIIQYIEPNLPRVAA